MSKKCAFVTGAEGFIGSHLVERLIKNGYKVKALVQYNSFGSWGWIDSLSDEIKSGIQVVLGDVRDPYCVKTHMKDVDTVFHLAALIAIPYSYHAPASYVETNIGGTLNIVQAAKELNIDRVIHTSTSEVYGTAQFVPINESHPLQGQSPYSASKIGADQIAMSFFTSFELPVSIIRPFNTFGPRQSSRAFIPTVIKQILANKPIIKLGALHPTRDFTYVEDTVDGFISIAESDKTVGEVINIGSNFEISMGETVKCISNILNRNVEIAIDKSRIRPSKSEVERLWADNTKAKKLTHWTPEFSGKAGFCRGLEKTIKWFQDQSISCDQKAEFYQI